MIENKENAAKFLDPEEKRRKEDYGKNIRGYYPDLKYNSTLNSKFIVYSRVLWHHVQ